jgi:hypothetical protein
MQTREKGAHFADRQFATARSVPINYQLRLKIGLYLSQ